MKEKGDLKYENMKEKAHPDKGHKVKKKKYKKDTLMEVNFAEIKIRGFRGFWAKPRNSAKFNPQEKSGGPSTKSNPREMNNAIGAKSIMSLIFHAVLAKYQLFPLIFPASII